MDKWYEEKRSREGDTGLKEENTGVRKISYAQLYCFVTHLKYLKQSFLKR